MRAQSFPIGRQSCNTSEPNLFELCCWGSCARDGGAALSPIQMGLTRKKKLKDGYDVEDQPIGVGGTAMVYRARPKKPNKVSGDAAVAVKSMQKGTLSQAEVEPVLMQAVRYHYWQDPGEEVRDERVRPRGPRGVSGWEGAEGV